MRLTSISNSTVFNLGRQNIFAAEHPSYATEMRTSTATIRFNLMNY